MAHTKIVRLRSSCAVLVALLQCVGCGCNREPQGLFSATAEQPPPPTGPLQYDSTVVAAKKPGDAIATLVEVATPANGRMRAIVAVAPADARAAADALAVEIWTFDQRNEAGVLERAGEPTPGLRMRAGDPSAPELGELRRELAAPAAEVHRLLGVEAADPAAAIASMAAAAAIVRASDVAAAPRLAALVTVARGLDDGPLLEEDALGRALDELAAGAWSPEQTRTISEQRAQVTTKAGAILELHKKGDGWVVATIR